MKNSKLSKFEASDLQDKICLTRQKGGVNKTKRGYEQDKSLKRAFLVLCLVWGVFCLALSCKVLSCLVVVIM